MLPALCAALCGLPTRVLGCLQLLRQLCGDAPSLLATHRQAAMSPAAHTLVLRVGLSEGEFL